MGIFTISIRSLDLRPSFHYLGCRILYTLLAVATVPNAIYFCPCVDSFVCDDLASEWTRFPHIRSYHLIICRNSSSADAGMWACIWPSDLATFWVSFVPPPDRTNRSIWERLLFALSGRVADVHAATLPLLWDYRVVKKIPLRTDAAITQMWRILCDNMICSRRMHLAQVNNTSSTIDSSILYTHPLLTVKCAHIQYAPTKQPHRVS